MSNHIVKIRCLNAQGWHNASIGECESCGGNSIRLETGEVIFGYVELTEEFEWYVKIRDVKFELIWMEGT